MYVKTKMLANKNEITPKYENIFVYSLNATATFSVDFVTFSVDFATFSVDFATFSVDFATFRVDFAIFRGVCDV